MMLFLADNPPTSDTPAAPSALPDDRVTALERQVKTLQWLHAELVYQLAQFVAPHQQQINTLAWLHTELVCQLKEILAQQQALVARAKAVRLAAKNNNVRG